MTREVPAPTQFTLEEAQQILPTVRERTADAVERASRVSMRLEGMTAGDPGRPALQAELDEIVTVWAREMGALGVVVKGLWLIDFDNGDGYYCWRFPETAVTHYHGYEGGFAGRMKIV